MDGQAKEGKRYSVSLQCAAEAVFGPDERLRRLLRQPQAEPKKNERNVWADGIKAIASTEH